MKSLTSLIEYETIPTSSLSFYKECLILSKRREEEREREREGGREGGKEGGRERGGEREREREGGRSRGLGRRGGGKDAHVHIKERERVTINSVVHVYTCNALLHLICNIYWIFLIIFKDI